VTTKRWWIVGVMLLVVLVVFRQRLFLRDPLARVERNGMRQTLTMVSRATFGTGSRRRTAGWVCPA
jgi:hypothetical protein